MRTDTSRGTFNDVIQNSPKPMAAIARKLRRLIVDIYPDVVEVPRPNEQHTSYGVGAEKDKEIFGYICPMTDYIRLGFYYGGVLRDPKGLLQGEGKRLRHIKIYSLAEVDRPEIRRLLKAAVQERKKAMELR
jgi:hypothetical protein